MVMYYRTAQEQMNDILTFGMPLMFMMVMFGLMKSLVSDTFRPESLPGLLPQIIPSRDGKEPTPHLTREQVTETILRNLVQAGVLLLEETGRYRRVLETYDNATLLRVLLHSHELREIRGE